MNKILFLFIIAAFVYACDKVDDPYADVNTGRPVVEDTTVTDTTDSSAVDTTIKSVQRKILIEDLTGHTCGNCPEAAEIAQDLKSQFGDQIIVAAIHAGYFAKPKSGSPPDPYLTDYRTTAGEEYNTSFNVVSNPIGMINRSDTLDNKILVGMNSWSTVVDQLKDLTSPVGISLETTYDNSSNEMNLQVDVKTYDSFSGEFNLVIYFLEDSIVDWQKDYRKSPEDIPDYVHNHVLRDNLNGTWGEQLFNGDTEGQQTVSKNYAYTPNANWEIDQALIIAYLYNVNTYEIIQVEEEHVIH